MFKKFISMMLLVTLRVRYLSNIVQVFMDHIHVHCLIEKLKICILLREKLKEEFGGYHI